MTLLKQIVRYVQRTETAIVRTLHMVNEYFGVSVVSEQGWRAPELNPGWVHRRINTYPEVRHSLTEHFSHAKYLDVYVSARIVPVEIFSRRVILTRFGRCVIHDSLAATPARYSLSSDIVCRFGA